MVFQKPIEAKKITFKIVPPKPLKIIIKTRGGPGQYFKPMPWVKNAIQKFNKSPKHQKSADHEVPCGADYEPKHSQSKLLCHIDKSPKLQYLGDILQLSKERPGYYSPSF